MKSIIGLDHRIKEMAKGVKISVITITYNSAKTLEDTIQSVLGQNYNNLEYIIIDGGSKDDTLSIVDKYKAQIAYVVSEKDNGISDAFNKGVRVATGEIIGIINSDDIMLPGTLSTLAGYYTPDVDIYGFNVLSWNSDTDERFRDNKEPSTNFDSLFRKHNVAHPGRFIRKDAYEKYGLYDERLRYLMDHDLLVRFYQKGAVFMNIHHDGALFRLGGITDDSIKKMKNDYKLYTLNNGGSKIDFYLYYAYKIIRNSVKRLLSIIATPEQIHKLSGRSSQ